MTESKTKSKSKTSDEVQKLSNRVPLLDALRGSAAFAVCFYHLTHKNPDLLSDGSFVKWLGSFGFLGVEAFFVISGFVIPYALFVKKYRLEAYPRFIFKRLVRLDPPYLACILLILVLNIVSSRSPGYHGVPFVIDWPALFAHLGYANAFLGFEWLCPVFWTLAIEFQYYLAMGLLFPLIASPHKPTRIATVVGLGSLSFLSSNTNYLVHWLPLFVLGMCVFQYRMKLLSKRECFLFMAVLTCVAFFTQRRPLSEWTPIDGALIACAGILCASCIFYAERLADYRFWRPLELIGIVSYSFYLLHVPVGVRVVNIVERFTSTDVQGYVAIVLATAASLAASWLFYKFIEGPSRALSARMRYFGAQPAFQKQEQKPTQKQKPALEMKA